VGQSLKWEPTATFFPFGIADRVIKYRVGQKFTHQRLKQPQISDGLKEHIIVRLVGAVSTVVGSCDPVYNFM